jgi:hypothetical protein
MSTPEPPSEREPLLADLPTLARPPRADRHGLRVTTPSSRRSTRLARPGPERDTTRRDETMQRGRTEVVLRSVGGTRQVAQCRTVPRRQLVELLPEQHLGLVRLAWRRRDVSELGHGRLKPPRGGAARPMGRRRQQRNAPGHRAGPVRRPPLRIRRLGVRVPPSAPHRPRSAAGWPATAGLSRSKYCITYCNRTGATAADGVRRTHRRAVWAGLTGRSRGLTAAAPEPHAWGADAVR